MCNKQKAKKALVLVETKMLNIVFEKVLVFQKSLISITDG